MRLKLWAVGPTSGCSARKRASGTTSSGDLSHSLAPSFDVPAPLGFIDVATETVFGALWARPGLDLKTRTLVCVVSDAATGRDPELAIHLRMALRQGWTEDELIEVLLHLSGYVGVPIIREAMLVAKQVFADVRAERK